MAHVKKLENILNTIVNKSDPQQETKLEFNKITSTDELEEFKEKLDATEGYKNQLVFFFENLWKRTITIFK